MNMYAKIKCFFGFCKDLEKLKSQQKEALEGVYKVEPKVQTLDIKEEFGNKVDETLSIINTAVVTDVTVTGVTRAKAKQKASKSEKSEKVTKVKRHWYNNSKTQKLVAEGEETSLPKTWSKGKLKAPKKDK